MTDKARALIRDYGRRLLDQGLTTGSGGNLSLIRRELETVIISPSGLDYHEISLEDVSLLDLAGCHQAGKAPSSEWHLHLEIYRQRPEINAVVHTHSRFATTLAVLRRPLPACHYLIGISGSHEIRVAPYTTFGTPELARITVAALGPDNCIIMANHGLLACGPDLPRAFATALYVEEVAELYCRALSLGEPTILNREEMTAALARFQTYGRQ